MYASAKKVTRKTEISRNCSNQNLSSIKYLYTCNIKWIKIFKI